MKTALLASDIDTALSFHLEKFHGKYSYIYNALGSQLSVHAQAMQPISPVYMRGDYAKYRIIQAHDVNGQTVNITYYVYFMKNADGIWQIEKY